MCVVVRARQGSNEGCFSWTHACLPYVSYHLELKHVPHYGEVRGGRNGAPRGVSLSVRTSVLNDGTRLRGPSVCVEVFVVQIGKGNDLFRFLLYMSSSIPLLQPYHIRRSKPHL